jgi:hypothetical protein
MGATGGSALAYHAQGRKFKPHNLLQNETLLEIMTTRKVKRNVLSISGPSTEYQSYNITAIRQQ